MTDEAPRALSILLVDDHQDSLDLLARLLRRCGHRVQTAKTVEEGLRALDAGRFDLLVSDLGLPDGSGAQVMQAIRDAQGAPGIALTGYGDDHHVRECEQAGFSARLLKPVVFEKLVEAMETALPEAVRPIC